jgi:Tfp pilus assembly protein PilO
MCVVVMVLVMVLVMHHDYRLSWKQMKDEDSAIERVGMQLENKRLSRGNFNSADESLNTYLHKTHLFPNQ